MISVILFAAFLSPALYSAAILALGGGYYIHRGFTRTNPLPDGTFTLLAVLAVFAALAVLGPTLAYGRAGQNIDAFKFFFATAAFGLGIAMATDRGGLLRHLPVFAVALTAYYAMLFFTDFALDQESPIYPPSNNHSAAMLAIFLPVIVLRSKGAARLALLLLMGAFAFFAASRGLLALTVLAAAATPQAVRRSRVVLAGAVLLAAAILFWEGFSMENFSDRLRLQIINVSIGYATTRGANAFNFGEAAFTDYLNIYPIYRRLDIEHAHNVLLQIWAAYGIVPLVVFSVFIVGLTAHAIRRRNYLLLGQLATLLLFGMIEALITDIRAFGTIMFALGYGFARGLPGHSADPALEEANADEIRGTNPGPGGEPPLQAPV